MVNNSVCLKLDEAKLNTKSGIRLIEIVKKLLKNTD